MDLICWAKSIAEERISELPLRKINVIDLFSGCGGLSYGFHHLTKNGNSVFRHLGAFDFDKNATETHRRSLAVPVHNLDLASATPADLIRVINPRNKNLPRPLIVIGGPPCQGFSAHRKKDPRKDTRNKLVAQFAQLGAGLDADLIVRENVRDLQSDRHRAHFDSFCRILEKAGYLTNSSVVNLAEFGVPQKRYRSLTLAWKKGVPASPKPVLGERDFHTVRDAIGGLPCVKAGAAPSSDDSMHFTSKHSRNTLSILRQIPDDGGSRPKGVGPKCLDRVAGFSDVYGRLAWDRPAVTLTTRCRTPSGGRYTHPEQHRGLTVREAAILQGFPLDFFFAGPFDTKFRQIGNAVPPIFSLFLASHVYALFANAKPSVKNSRSRHREPTTDLF